MLRRLISERRLPRKLEPNGTRYRRRTDPFAVYLQEPDRPLCVFCGDHTHKRAVFYDRRRHRPLCARCSVGLYRDHILTNPHVYTPVERETARELRVLEEERAL